MDERTTEFLAALWRGGKYSNYWRLVDKQVQWFPVDQDIPICILGDTNIYMSVHPCGAIRGKYERTRIEDVQCINCLFTEFDTKDFENDAATRAHITSLKFQPHVIVSSGGGYHCYFMLSESVPVTSDSVYYLSGIQSAWVKLCGGDKGSKDLARVLRLPGTHNAKYKPMRKVQFVRFEMETRLPYDMADLCALAEPYWEEAPTAPVSEVPVSTVEHGQHSGAVAAVINTFSAAQNGNRNELLLWAACKLYEHGLSPASVQSELAPIAIRIGLTESETLATIKSAAKQPARAPEPWSPPHRIPTRSRSLEEANAAISRKYAS